jgi:bifunctional DNA-binding transcriptional regulator/antitoxin component of YhaV-PrlF toxin-antitoxin module
VKNQATGAKIVRVLRGGQITLPVEFRRKMHIDDSSLLRMTLDEEGELHVKPVTALIDDVASLRMSELYDRFAPVRQRLLEQGTSHEEASALIDRAIQQTRASRNQGKGSPWLKELYEMFADVRQEAIDKGYTDDQINEWIDEAVEASRRDRATAADSTNSPESHNLPPARRTA